VSDVSGNANCAERNRDRYNSLGHNRGSTQPVTDVGAGTTIESSGHAVEQSRIESARQPGRYFC
jgi:hypothetical protein